MQPLTYILYRIDQWVIWNHQAWIISKKIRCFKVCLDFQLTLIMNVSLLIIISLTSLIRTNRAFQKSSRDYVFRLIDNPEFPHQNVKYTICPE